MNNHRKRYTPAEDAKILAKAGTFPQIGAQLGRSAAAISQRRYVLTHPEFVPPVKLFPDANRRNIRKYRSRGYQYPNKKHWTAEEDVAISSPDRPDDVRLSHQLQRTIPSIQSRRSVLRDKHGWEAKPLKASVQ